MRHRRTPAALLAVLALWLAGCQFGGIRGSGDVVERSPEVTAFGELEVSHAFVVDAVVGPEPSLTVEADDNVVDHVIATVSGDVLRLGLRPGYQVRDATLRATVTTPRLDEVRTSGATVVRVDGTIDTERWQTRLSGASEVTAQVDVAEIDVVATGASTLRLEGAAGTARLEPSGASDLELGDLRTRATEATLSGASSVEVGVDETLAVDLSGGSTLTYLGDPEITRESLSGGARLEQG